MTEQKFYLTIDQNARGVYAKVGETFYEYGNNIYDLVARLYSMNTYGRIQRAEEIEEGILQVDIGKDAKTIVSFHIRKANEGEVITGTRKYFGTDME